ncbi:lipopolysaccharide assembly protein LapA domain-containing protein [Terrihabitans sp. B22-R8]|uniref:lipopolysaccharide assembly protein LapA domain-containing protein n=1 Tax=Terrihabitans sp. B22-R8 TaxID=3425128 RepID=UPI00403C7C35
MRRLLTILVLVPLAALFVVLALANRTPVTLSLDPFSPEVSAYSIQLPLFLVILLSVGIGLLVGGFADWLSQGRYRREARDRRYEVRRLEEETANLRATAPSGGLPVPYQGESPRL